MHSNLKLAYKLANEGYNVFWINCQLETNLGYKLQMGSLFLNDTNNCSFTAGTQAKARMEHASLKSFKDFRVKLKNIINDSTKNVDPNNVFVSGISAGAILSVYSVFLDSIEIPKSISYVNCGGDPPVNINTSSLATGGYPMPAIKGIIPMAGGSFYNNIFNNTTHSNNTAVNFMHGTCDEIINQNQNRVSYKFYNSGFIYNSYDANRYPTVYGSKYMYNQLVLNHSKIGFGQVINGGHSIFQTKITSDLGFGGWDVYDLPPLYPIVQPNLNSPINQRDIVFDNISSFMKRVMGETGPAWTNHAYSVFPDIPTEFCLTDDQTLLSPPIITVDTVCGTVVAAVSNPPAWATITWSVSNKLQIVGSNTGTAIAYKGLRAGSGTLTASVDYGNGVVIPVSKNVVIPTTCPSPCNGIFYFNNQNVSTNTSIIHCGNIHSQNITVNSGVSLTLDATGYVLIPNNFEVPVGATLEVNP